jgi:hypothetical protein
MKLTVTEFAFLIAECMNKDEAAMESARKGLTERYFQKGIDNVINSLKGFFCDNNDEIEMYSFKLSGYSEMCSRVYEWDPRKMTLPHDNGFYRFRLSCEDSQK